MKLIENVRTVIVGSGVSGISSALNLLKNGDDEFYKFEKKLKPAIFKLKACFVSEVIKNLIEKIRAHNVKSHTD